jgi:putative tryptophan/tyrosine transport system substrate-binding protein
MVNPGGSAKMRRRELMAGLTYALSIRQTWGQQKSERQYRIAILDPATPVGAMNESTGPEYPIWRPLFRELRRLGFAEGQNLAVERYSGRSNYSPSIASRIVLSRPDVILALDGQIVRQLISLTDTIPIVGLISDPVGTGLASSMARPGGNVTGIAIDTGYDVWGKRLELLREMVPTMSRVGVLTLQVVWAQFLGAVIQKLSKMMGVAVVGPFLERPVTPAEFRRVFAAMSKEGVNTLCVGEVVEIFINAPLVIQLAQEFHLPTLYGYRYHVRIGGLMAYDYGIADFGGIIADQIDKILVGTYPGDIPIYQPHGFTLAINLKTAKALGLAVPQALLARADEVIE